MIYETDNQSIITNNSLNQSTRDNVKVIVRLRPKLDKERDSSSSVKVDNNTVTFLNSNKIFNFDFVANENIGQEELFYVSACEIAESALNGYNGTIFVYGQTGAGKTYTLMGKNSEDALINEKSGILPRTLDYLFKKINSEYKSNLISVKCSFLEIYKESLYDLLSQETPNHQSASFSYSNTLNSSTLSSNGFNSSSNNNYFNQQKKDLYIRDQGDSVKVENLSMYQITNTESAINLIQQGLKYRATAPTACNNESSRSHAVFSIYIENKFKVNNKKITKKSVFHLIDLAGSERQKLTETTGDRTKEAGQINKSLMLLGHVIKSLVDSDGKKFIHYRDTKLTHLLKDSLGGNSKTCIIANITPSHFSSQETLSTLQFAQSAKQIKNKVKVNEEIHSDSFYKEELKKILEQYENIKQENKHLQKMIKEGNFNLNGKNMINESFYATGSLDVLSKQLAIMEEETTLKDNKISELIGENSFLRERIERLDIDFKLLKLEKRDEERKLNDLYDEIRKVKEELHKEQFINIKLSEDKDDLRRLLIQKENKLTSECNEAVERLNEIRKKLVNKEEELKIVKEELALQENETRMKEDKIRKIEETLLTKEMIINDLNLLLKQKEVEISSVQKDLNSLELTKSKQIERLVEEKSTLQSNLLSKQQELNTIRIAKESLLNQVKHLESEILKLKKINKKHVDSLIFSNNEKLTLEEKVFTGSKLLLDKEKQIETFRTEILILNDNKKFLENALENINKEYNILIENKTNSSKISTMISQKNQIQDLQKEIQVKNKQISTLEGFLKNLNITGKSTKSLNPLEIIGEIERKTSDLNSNRSILHEFLLKIKNSLDLNSEGFKISDLAEKYLEGKSLEERFSFYMNEYLKYTEFLEKSVKSSNEENSEKLKNINELKKQIERQSLIERDDSTLKISENGSLVVFPYEETVKVQREDEVNESDPVATNIVNAILNGYNDKQAKSNILKKVNEADLVDMNSLCKSVSQIGKKRSFNQISPKEDLQDENKENQNILLNLSQEGINERRKRLSNNGLI